MFGLLGPNGAGKTTLLSILSSLLTATSGTVQIFGRAVHPSNRALRRLVGIVPQELAIYGELTARENLRFFGELFGVRGPELCRRVDEVLAAIGLDDRADRRVDTFSGGMKRRLNLGAALVHQPRLLLLDEPTAGVDPQSRNHIFEEVRRLNATGITIVYTSHYMEEVQALCPRVGIIDHGKLIACDDVKNLLAQLPSRLRLSVRKMPANTLTRLQSLNEVKVATPTAESIEIECKDMKRTLLQVVSILSE